ncbi:CAZyme family AA11 [Penicillium waksmanii]|uniref:CAZyme family AA11 n=1 Tax=Penicillium waksmanii TaxID=69791 RepID=UPI0025481548|nr:CAZyme family AA11 [Penicillium waksmanii]KAJ5995102.1 CAZyme family AA11 [Penicillium waksmanii]
MMFTNSLIATVLSASMVNAHMIMSNPVPYSKDSLNNSPLAADGSDFPCKLRSNTFEVTKENIIAQGASQQLTFEGSAVHGGGSCQISLTTDREPTKDSEWKVIQSYEGGCPAKADGNLSGNDDSVFHFDMPSDIEAGKYTLAWTWFNRIGNREMYMNCAPVTVTGGSKKRAPKEEKIIEKRTANYPPMFVANVNGCTTKEGIDIRFPQPGAKIQYLGTAANLAPEGEDACTGPASFGGAGISGSGSSGSGSGSGSATSAGPSTAPTSSGPADPAPTTTQAPTETTAPVAPQPVPSSTQAAPVPSATSGGSSSGSSSAGTLTGACSPEGQWNCIAGSSFQRCANGQWSVSQQLASGTKCDAGQSSNLSVSASKRAHEISALRFRKRTIGESHHA